MARANTVTKLSLDRFAQIVGIHPLHFNQVTVSGLAPSTTCDSPLIQYSWQEADRVGREEIAQAISDAEANIEEQLNFSLIPTWQVAEDVSYLPPASPELYNYSGKNQNYQWNAVRTNKRLLISGGQEAFTLLAAAAAVVYADGDGDGYFETATIVVATSVTNTEEIAVYHSGHGADPAYEIRPITVVIGGGNATIVCRREQLVLPTLWEALDPQAVDGLINTNFEATVAVYRHYNDPSVQAQFLWENPDNVGSYDSQYGVANIRDARLGFLALQPATWDSILSAFASSTWVDSRQPDRVRLYYQAGYRGRTYPYTRMDPFWERAVAYYALAMLDRPICGCSSISQYTMHWQEDLAISISSPSGSNSAQLTQSQMECPFGTTRGALYAWRAVQKYSVGGSASERA